MKFITFLEKRKPNFLSFFIQKLIFPKCQSLLDVGCGDNSVVQFFNSKINKTVGIDVFKKSIEKSQTKQIHQKYFTADICHLEKYFKPKSFDAVISIDVIEHFKKNDAVTLIKKIEKISRKIVILQTPNGFIPQKTYKHNKYQQHLCGFDTNELKKLGYRVIGMDGPKFLRGNRAAIKYHPKILFSILSNLLTPLFFFLPQYSFSLLAYKKNGN